MHDHPGSDQRLAGVEPPRLSERFEGVLAVREEVTHQRAVCNEHHHRTGGRNYQKRAHHSEIQPIPELSSEEGDEPDHDGVDDYIEDRIGAGRERRDTPGPCIEREENGVSDQDERERDQHEDAVGGRLFHVRLSSPLCLPYGQDLRGTCATKFYLYDNISILKSQ